MLQSHANSSLWCSQEATFRLCQGPRSSPLALAFLRMHRASVLELQSQGRRLQALAQLGSGLFGVPETTLQTVWFAGLT